MEHFDRNHVSVVAPGGKRIYPPVRPVVPTSPTDQSSPPSPSTSSTASTPSLSSRSPSVEASPPPATPITPACLPLDPVSKPIPDVPLHYNSYTGLALSFGSTESSPNDPCPYSYDVISAFGPEYDFTKDYACYEWAYAEKLKRKRLEEQREQEQKQRDAERSEREVYASTWVPPVTSEDPNRADNTARSSISPPPSSSTSDSDSYSDSLPGGSPTGPTPSKKSKPRKDGPITNNGGKVSKPKGKSTGASGASSPMSSSGRKREKNFKCPVSSIVVTGVATTDSLSLLRYPSALHY